jgi:hypothetical protein
MSCATLIDEGTLSCLVAEFPSASAARGAADALGGEFAQAGTGFSVSLLPPAGVERGHAVAVHRGSSLLTRCLFFVAGALLAPGVVSALRLLAGPDLGPGGWPGMVAVALVGGVVGLCLGILLTWTLHRPSAGRNACEAASDGCWVLQVESRGLADQYRIRQLLQAHGGTVRSELDTR